MPTMRTDQHLTHVEGYLALGMLAEAAAELDRIPPPDCDTVTVLDYRLSVLQAQENWPELARIASIIAKRTPHDAAAWVTWAYATRRAVSIVEAEKILYEASVRHPDDATIQFNLGCYACQQGKLEAARRRVKHAISLDPLFKETAATDPDLAPLRESTEADGTKPS